MSKKQETALAIFEKHEVLPVLQKRILEMDPNFSSRPQEEQEEILVYLLQQATKTLEGVRSRFPMINIRHAGTNAIELPKPVGAEDNPIVREFEGIILDQYMTKAFWEKSYGGEDSGGPPDCASLNCLTPYTKDPVNEDCPTCPHNVFGTGIDRDGNQTKGKRCRDQKRAIMKLEEYELPCRMMFSPKNIGPFDLYMLDLQNQGKPIGTIVTKFKAASAKAGGGQEYTGIEFATARSLSLDEVLEIKRNVVEPFQDDFRLGAIEANEGQASGGPAPSQEDLEKGTGKKASDVL